MPLTTAARVGLAAGLLALPTGCLRQPAAPEVKQPPAAPAKTPGPLQVKSDGACLPLGELQRPSVLPEAFAGKVGEFLAAGRPSAARGYVLRFPDVAADALRSCDPARASEPGVAFTAAVLDETRGGSDWQAWTKSLSGPGRGYASKRAALAAGLRSGVADPKAAVAVAAVAPAMPPLAADARRLHGQVLMLAGRPADAIAPLGEAAKLSEGDPAETATSLLLLGEAHRRGGHLPEAKATWAKAVEAAARSLDRAEPVVDPGLWERASYFKPVDAAWPDSAVRALAEVGAGRVVGRVPAGSAPPELWLWAVVGSARADRGEYQAALAAFHRGQTCAADRTAKASLAVAQARVLMLIGQTQPAAAVLVPLTDQHPAASALLGAIKLSDGATDQALLLLRRAVESPSDWPGRAEAEADLGLALLMTGNESEGLRRLAAARERFRVAGDEDSVARAWDNEARYWESIDRSAEAAAARQRLARPASTVTPPSVIPTQTLLPSH